MMKMRKRPVDEEEQEARDGYRKQNTMDPPLKIVTLQELHLQHTTDVNVKNSKK